MFYDRFIALCEKKGVRPSRAAKEMGFEKSTVANWKAKWEKGIDTLPRNDILTKIINYFKVSYTEVLGIDEAIGDSGDTEFLELVGPKQKEPESLNSVEDALRAVLESSGVGMEKVDSNYLLNAGGFGGCQMVEPAQLLDKAAEASKQPAEQLIARVMQRTSLSESDVLAKLGAKKPAIQKDDGQDGTDIVVYSRNGQKVRKRVSKEDMDIIAGMLDKFTPVDPMNDEDL